MISNANTDMNNMIIKELEARKSQHITNIQDDDIASLCQGLKPHEIDCLKYMYSLDNISIKDLCNEIEDIPIRDINCECQKNPIIPYKIPDELGKVLKQYRLTIRSFQDQKTIDENEFLNSGLFSENSIIQDSISGESILRHEKIEKKIPNNDFSSCLDSVNYTSIISTNNPSLMPNASIQKFQNFMHKQKTNMAKIIESCLRKKLFERFLVIGINKTKLQNATTNINSPKLRFFPKIQYAFPVIQENSEVCYSILSQLAFPFGIKVQKTDKKVNEIICHDYLATINSDFFIFTINSPESNSSDMILDEIIESSNPGKRQYIICWKVEDFYVINDRQGKKNSIWSTEKILCFVTYFPFFELFKDFFHNILGILKSLRMEVLKSHDFHNDYQRIDSEFVDNVISTKFEVIFRQALDIYPQLNNSISIHLNLNQSISLEFNLRNLKILPNLEALWASHLVFSYLSLKDLIFLFTTAILESRLVIMSQVYGLCTGVLFMLYSLIKPFLYQAHMVFSLPQDEKFLEMLNAPGSFLIGLNANEEFLKRKKLAKISSCIFVLLDEKKIIAENDLIDMKTIPNFDNFEKKLEPYYYQINPIKVYELMRINNNQNDKQSVNNASNMVSKLFNENSKATCLKIMAIFRSTLENHVIKCLPSSPILDKHGEISFSEILKYLTKDKKNESDRIFLHNLVDTQTFHYFVEQKYL